MVGKIVPRIEQEVKRCNDEHCDEDVFRDGPLCLKHYVAEETATWDDEDAERQMALKGVGHVFGDPVEVLA